MNSHKELGCARKERKLAYWKLEQTQKELANAYIMSVRWLARSAMKT